MDREDENSSLFFLPVFSSFPFSYRAPLSRKERRTVSYSPFEVVY